MDLKILRLGGFASVLWPPEPPVSYGYLNRATLEPWEQGCHCDQEGGVVPLIDLPVRLPPRKLILILWGWSGWERRLRMSWAAVYILEQLRIDPQTWLQKSCWLGEGRPLLA